MKVFLAIDLGAGSGRVLAARTDFDSLDLEEIHRFENPVLDLPGGLFWSLGGLYREILKGLRLAVGKFGDAIVSLGIDTWGCDYALLDHTGRLLGVPQPYRDTRSQGMAAEAGRRLGQDKIYAATGVMPAFYNTSEHLLGELLREAPSLLHAERLLFIPDLLGYWLTGVQATETTVASTSQLTDPARRDWSWEVIDGLGLPRRLFGPLTEPGAVLGQLRSEVVAEIGRDIRVITTASHDTAAAVAGIPGHGEYAWLSSGTWSIIGIESPQPILTSEARHAGFANELGVEGTVRVLKNISGAWLIQECRRDWAQRGEDLDYTAMAVLATEADGFTAFVDPDDDQLAHPGNMPAKIVEFCRRTGQPVPVEKGAILRVAIESIALKHRIRFRQLRELSGRSLDRIHMGGGGSRNVFLTQAIADACQVPVHAGPVEATACGNLIVQMTATGDLPGIAAGRRLIARALPPKIFEPKQPEIWNEPAERFALLLN